MARGGRRSGAGRKAGVRSGPTAKTKAVRAKIAKSVELSAAATLEAIHDGAMWDPADLFDEKNNVLPIRKMSRVARRAIVGFEVLKRNLTAGDDAIDTILKVVLTRDRSRYVEMAAKHHGQLIDKIEVTGEMSLMEKIARARARVQTRNV